MDLILLHGALGSQRDFDRLVPLLAEKYTVHAFNFEGHGGVEAHEPLRISLFVRNLSAYFAEKGIRKASIFGYSMGGYVALNYALQFPEQVEKIVTLGTKMSWSPAIAEQEVKQLDPGKIAEKVPQFAEALALQHGSGEWKTLVNSTAVLMQELGNGAALTDTQFKQIRTPVSLLRAEGDVMVTAAETEYVRQLLFDSTSETIAGAKHPIHTVPVDQLSALIIAALTPSA